MLCWRLPRLSTIYDMLRHPFYAGAYVYGRCVDRSAGPGGGQARPKVGTAGRVGVPSAGPTAGLYHLGAVRGEPSEDGRQDKGRGRKARVERPTTLLNGLARCGRCGRTMAACKTYEIREPRYVCDPGHFEVGMPPCQSLAAIPVDRLIESLVLEAVRPAALELSLRAAEQAGRDRDRLHVVWRQKVERRELRGRSGRRQYDAAEPENRLVARELERRWEQALAEARRVEEDYARFQAERPRELTVAERDRIRALAADVPALWRADTTRGSDRRAIVRLLIERVELSRRGGTELVDVVVHWRGGARPTCGPAAAAPLRRPGAVRRVAGAGERASWARDDG